MTTIKIQNSIVFHCESPKIFTDYHLYMDQNRNKLEEGRVSKNFFYDPLGKISRDFRTLDAFLKSKIFDLPSSVSSTREQ